MLFSSSASVSRTGSLLLPLLPLLPHQKRFGSAIAWFGAPDEGGGDEEATNAHASMRALPFWICSPCPLLTRVRPCRVNVPPGWPLPNTNTCSAPPPSRMKEPESAESPIRDRLCPWGLW